MENRDEDLKALENNLDGEVNQDKEEETKCAVVSNSILDITTNSSNLNHSTSSALNPEAATQQEPDLSGVDQTKVISDYLLTKLFDNLDQSKFAQMANKMTPDAKYYISKNMNDLREKFAGFVGKFIKPG